MQSNEMTAHLLKRVENVKHNCIQNNSLEEIHNSSSIEKCKRMSFQDVKINFLPKNFPSTNVFMNNAVYKSFQFYYVTKNYYIWSYFFTLYFVL